MKIRNIKISILVGLVVLFNIISILSYKRDKNFITIIEPKYGVQNIESDGILPFKTSETLTEMDPILIDDSLTGVGAYNWSWAANQSWCRGSGTYNDPYVIENLKIDGNKTDSCIHIKNSGVFFRIENCTLYNSKEGTTPNFEAGIKLGNVANGTITNNNCSFNQKGIYLQSSPYNNISNNYVANNSGNGINLVTASSSNCRITGNTVIYNGQGIGLMTGDVNVISGNIIEENEGSGINLYYADWCQILDNTILENKDEGITFGCSNGNKIVGNVIRGCGTYGVSLIHQPGPLSGLCRNNHFYENYLRDNGLNAYDTNLTANNKWNNSAIGNYWDDYTGIDMNSDGIGDTPYNINLLPLIQDRLPIYDVTAPNITVITPANNSVFGTTAPEFTLNVTDSRLYRIWYTLDGGKTNYSCSTSGKINQDAWDALNESKMILRFYAEDKPGNIGYLEIVLEKSVTNQTLLLILIILGVIALVIVISVIIIRKRSKKEKGHWITKDGRRIFIKD